MNGSLLTMRDLAQQLQVTTRSIIRWRNNGTLPPAVQIGPRLVRWRQADISAWIEGGCVPWRKTQRRAR